MDAESVPVQVRRAVEALKRATSALINLLKSPDEAVRAGAAAALKELPAPPTLALGEALLGRRDTDFRLRIIKVLVALAAVDRVRVLCVLSEAFKERRDLEVKRAVATALLVLVSERSGPSPSPVERPAPDPKREEYPRDWGQFVERADRDAAERTDRHPDERR
jgi:hypothetical protein